MIMLTGYLMEVGDDEHGSPFAMFDIGDDKNLTISNLAEDEAQQLGQHLLELITVTWCGSGWTVAVVEKIEP